jgi:hypothetical protein
MYTAGFYVILFMTCKTITWPTVVDLVLVRTPTWGGGGDVSWLEKLTTPEQEVFNKYLTSFDCCSVSGIIASMITYLIYC